ncbi:prepilin-type N-terminal cleavage/methylation domain-containing protein [Alkalihalobacillus sp. 1P02AB]|uniref:prepilin-type N-terminal cleavage/methylation domain-containing protein n=1 Tax=Alkalihalobacillus sp. 1P02AB TaxID=3132260 RepID=UPI0039A70073
MPKDNRGMTLIELLLAVSLGSLLFLILPTIMLVFSESVRGEKTTDWEAMVFFNLLAQEVRGAVSVEGTENGVRIYRSDGVLISMQRQQGGTIVFQKNFEGYVLMQSEVHSFKCVNVQELITCTLIKENEKTYTRTMVAVPFAWEVENE